MEFKYYFLHSAVLGNCPTDHMLALFFRFHNDSCLYNLIKNYSKKKKKKNHKFVLQY
jgi:hypothetical protein